MENKTDADARVILALLAARPREYLAARDLASEAKLTPEHVNDAIASLVKSGDAEGIEAMGTAPPGFSGAYITSRGRSEYQRRSGARGDSTVQRAMLGLCALVSLAICLLVAIGAPPSEFVRDGGIWTYFEWLMLPGLLAGPVLAFTALLLVFVSVRAGAVACMFGIAASTVGLIIAWGFDAEGGAPQTLIVAFAMMAVPFLCAAWLARDAAREQRQPPAGPEHVVDSQRP